MDDALRAVDLDRRPVGLHGGDLAAGDAPQQTGAVQVVQRARWMTARSAQPPRPCMNWSKSFRKRPTDAAALRHALVGDANARRPAPNPAGCPAWARSRQPRYWAWNAAALVGNDPRHRGPCRRPSPASDRPPREQGTRGGRAAQAAELSDVLAGGTYWSWGRGVNNRRTIGGRSGTDNASRQRRTHQPSTGRSASSIGVPRRPTWCFLRSVRHSHGGLACPIR